MWTEPSVKPSIVKFSPKTPIGKSSRPGSFASNIHSAQSGGNKRPYPYHRARSYPLADLHPNLASVRQRGPRPALCRLTWCHFFHAKPLLGINRNSRRSVSYRSPNTTRTQEMAETTSSTIWVRAGAEIPSDDASIVPDREGPDANLPSPPSSEPGLRWRELT